MPHKSQQNSAQSKPPSLRQITLELLRKVTSQGQMLHDAFASHAAWQALPPRDRRFVRRLLTISLRHYGDAQEVLTKFMRKPLSSRDSKALDILIIGVVELLWADSASHAAVDEAVNLMRSQGFHNLTRLANGILRSIERDRSALQAADYDPFGNAADWLKNGLIRDWGDGAPSIMASLLTLPALDIRVKSDPDLWADTLGGIALRHGTVRRRDGFVAELSGYDEGAWWIQDAAASVPALLFNSILSDMAGGIAGKHIVDLCAAPGGKTAQLCASGAKVTAVDNSPSRLKTLNENMTRLGFSPQVVAADGASWRPENLVDGVLLDAPCSATGTIRRRPDILRAAKPDFDSLAKIQRSLLDKAASWLKPGGVLIYATCSLLKREGEDIIANPLPSLAPSEIAGDEVAGFKVIHSAPHAIRLMPDSLDNAPDSLDGNDGFFIARFTKL